MATCKMYAVEDFALMLSKLDTNADMIAKKAIYEGAGILADEINKNLKRVLSDDATGEMAKSFGIAPIKNNYEGWDTKLGFEGYDSKGTPNQLKARVLESGKHNQPKRPFVRPSINKKKKEVVQVMDETINEEIKKLDK